MRSGAIDMAMTELNRVNTLPFHMRMNNGDNHE